MRGEVMAKMGRVEREVKAVLDPSKFSSAVLEQIVLPVDVKDSFLKLVCSLILITLDGLLSERGEGN